MEFRKMVYSGLLVSTLCLTGCEATYEQKQKSWAEIWARREAKEARRQEQIQKDRENYWARHPNGESGATPAQYLNLLGIFSGIAAGGRNLAPQQRNVLENISAGATTGAIIEGQKEAAREINK